MGLMTASDILDVWERGRSRHPIDRALTILAAAMPEASHHDLMTLPIGRRDVALLRIRADTFGQLLDGRIRCANCDEQLEFEIGIDEILAEDSPMMIGDGGEDERYTLNVDGAEYRFRLPNSLDLATATGSSDPESARQIIAHRCIVARPETDDPEGPIPDEHLTALSKQIAKHDRYADITFRLDCPFCGHTGDAVLDIVSFLWTEIDSAARGLIGDVHILASAYGWSEADILSLSAARRATYIDMVS